MAKTLTHLTVFISAPSSMDVQRKLVTGMIEKLPEALLDSKGLRFKVISWESDVTPGIGSDAQNVISSQIGEDYDVYVGLLGGHFGSPTPRAGSGTEEEFDLAYSRYERKPASVRILFYFKGGTDDIFALDLGQLTKVKKFKDKLKDGGVLFHDFRDDDALAKAISNHVQQLIQRQWKGKDWSVLSPRTMPELEGTDPLGRVHTIPNLC